MLCERCGQREATHHDLVVNGSEVHETHLCEECAREIGVSASPTASVNEWLTNFVLSPPTAKPGRPESVLRCGHCGLTFTQFKKTGLMGCSGCYEAFESRLVPLLERAHEGASQHVGKVPRRALSSNRLRDEAGAEVMVDVHARAGRIESLRRELAEAVKAEAYEKAANIRDALFELTNPSRSIEDEA